MTKYINWYDTRLQKKEVDQFFYALSDMLNELKAVMPEEYDYISKKYGFFEYSTEFENYSVRVGFKDD